MFHKLRTSTKRRLTGTVLFMHLFVVVLGNFTFPQPAQALFGVGDVSITAADIPRIAGQVLLEALKQVGSALKVTLVEVSTYLGQKIAHDAAVHLVAGASGQKPLFSVKDAGQYALDLGADAVAQTLSGFVDNLVHLDICTFDPKMNLQLALGFAGTAGPQGRKCNFKTLSARFDKIKDEAASFAADPAQGFAARFSVKFVPGNSTLDGYTSGIFSTNWQVQKQIIAQKEAELLNRLGQVKAVTDVVTGAIKTPKEVLTAKIIDDAVMKPARDIERSMDAALKASPEEIFTIVGLSVKSFVATLLGEATKKIFAGLAPTGAANLANPFASSSTGVADAQQALRSLLAVQPAAVAQYDTVGLYTACPQGASIQRNPDNCVMDPQMASAVRRGTTDAPVTVKDAIDQGFLKADFPFIGPHDARNQSPNCYLQGYCYSNLVKLRRSRIISIGWEMAAIIAEKERQGTTLAEVVSSFDGSNLQSFKHLIDPNWILKYPPTQCRQLVNGATLLSDRTPNRHETCVDTPSCIQEDGAGNCLGAYGYCTQEKNVWRFDGDSCPKEMASCLSFTRPDSGKAAYLMNTTDAGLCNSSNAGCRNYFMNPSPKPQVLASPISTTIINSTGGTGSQFLVDPAAYATFNIGDLICAGGDCALVPPKGISVTDIQKVGTDIKVTVSSAITWTPNETIQKLELTGSSMYLNKNAAPCAATDKGCTDLVDLTTKNTPANLLTNPSFETDIDSNTAADGWAGNTSIVSSNAASGTKSVTIGGATEIGQYVTLQPNSFYTLSFAAKTLTGSPKITVFAKFLNTSTYTVVSTTPGVPVDTTNTFARYSSTFSTPQGSGAPILVYVLASSSPSGSFSVDSAQLEFGESATEYHENYPVTAQHVFMKAPPAVLGCQGLPTDDPSCSSYAGVCAKADVGCERYVPTNGDPAVAGSLSQLDLCPASCVGYDTFKQLGYDDASMNHAGFEIAKFPVFMSPTFPGAKSCSVAAAGCDEFTNLQTVASGGEGREYYTKVRKCQVTTPGDDTASFYTWEGSDTAGLQLKTWKLKKSDVGVGPCSNGRFDGDGVSAVYACHDAEPGGVTDANVATVQPTCKEHDDVARNPDCREFYDELGAVHYRLLSLTTISADTCTQLRRTLVSAGAQGSADCSATGGRWTAASSQCIYFALPQLSQSCTVQEVGCRAYRGNAGANTRQVFNETFENVTPDGSGAVLNYPTGTYSNESLAANGHSLKSAVRVVSAKLDGKLEVGKTYQVTFWAKSAATTPNTLLWKVDFNPTSSFPTVLADFTAGTVVNEWTRLVTNSITITPLVPGSTEQNPLLKISSSTDDFYIDNIEIREVQSVVAFVKDSWRVPAECDATFQGTSSPQEMLGCRAYTDRAGRRVTARSFTRLCTDGAVGCKAFADTQNSSTIGQQTFNARCYAAQPGSAVLVTTLCKVKRVNNTDLDACQVVPGQNFCRFNTNEMIRMSPIPAGSVTLNVAYSASDTVVVSSDTVRYLIDDPGKRCSAEVKGCYEFGAAQYNRDQTSIVGVGKKTMLNLPDQYATTLCGQEQNFCDAFGGDDNALHYFKDPEAKVPGAPNVPGKTCEFRDDVLVNGEHRSGWFKKGTDLPCYDNFVIGGGFNGIRKNADPSFDSWVGSCQAAVSKCTEFRDPTDRSDQDPLGKSYYFLKNERVLSNTCNQVSRREGCGMFEDTTNPTKLWNAEASYAASDAAGGTLATAVSCTSDSSNPACKNRCRLSFVDIQGTPEPTRLITGDVCVRDEDCSGLKRPGKRISDARCVDITNSSETGAAVFESPRDENPLTQSKPLDNVNMILKVRRDRECGEWLSCTTSSPIYDSVTQQTRDVCNEVRACDLAIGTNSGGTACANFVDTPREALTRGAYQDRDISWKGGDLSGYSVPGLVSVDRVSQVNVSGKCASGSTKTDQACFSSADCPPSSGTVNKKCEPNQDDADLRMAHRIGTSVCIGKSNGDSCQMGYCRNNPTLTCTANSPITGTSGECGGGVCSFDNTRNGKCFDSTCVQLAGNAAEIDNPNLEDFDVLTRQPESQACRAYPENEGPVPASVVKLEDWKKRVLIGDSYVISQSDNISSETVQWSPLQRNPQYNGANVCAFAKTADGTSYRTCECQYSKATYGGATVVKYYPEGTRSRIKPFICSGGPLDGAACIPSEKPEDDPCGPEGQCQGLQKIDNAQGVLGYCLQRDLSININGDSSNPCALWLPVDGLPGSTDIYNQDENAGFVPPEDDLYYCAESAGRSKPNNKYTAAPQVAEVVNESEKGGIICQSTSNSCDVQISQDQCESNQGCAPSLDMGDRHCCKWVSGRCKTYLLNLPEPPGIPALPPGCDVPVPTSHCEMRENLGKWYPFYNDEPIFNDNYCCINDHWDDRGPGVVPKQCGSQPTCTSQAINPPSGDLLAEGCGDIDKIIIGVTVGAVIAGGIHGYLLILASPFLAAIAGSATLQCANLSQPGAGVCGFIQRFDRTVFSVINNPCGPLGGACSALIAGSAASGESTLRRTSATRGNNPTSGLNPFDSANAGRVPLYGEVRGDSSGIDHLVSDHGVIPKNIRMDEVAAIRVTAGGDNPETSAIPRTFFLLPPYFQASFFWNGGIKDDNNRTEDGKALTFDSYDAKCGDPGVECNEKPALGKTCDYFFDSAGHCQTLRLDITQDNKGIENCAAIKANFLYCDTSGNNCVGATYCEKNTDGTLDTGHCSPTRQYRDPNKPEVIAYCDADASTGNVGTSNCSLTVPIGKLPRFDGFSSGMCIRSNTHGGTLPVKIDVLLKETCNVATQVAKLPESSVIPSMVPYTDRVWAGGQDLTKKFKDNVPLLTSGRSASSDPFFPYGALAFKGSDASLLGGHSAGLYALTRSLGEPPFQPMKAVLPTDLKPGDRTNMAVTQVAPLAGQPAGGYSFGCAPDPDGSGPLTSVGDCSSLNPQGSKTPIDPLNTLKNLFAKAYGAFRWDGNGYMPSTAAGDAAKSWDLRNPDCQVGATGCSPATSAPLDIGAHEPYIYPIKQSSCRPTDGKCAMDLAAKNTITVNDKNDGVVQGAGSVKATVKFYFETDKNHMPAKRIVVDWGDRVDTTDLTVNYGLYKNRVGYRTGAIGDGVAGKPGCDGDQAYCSNDATKQCSKDGDCSGGTCTTNTGFGRATRACEDAYIAFSHTYTCDDTTYALGTTPIADALVKGMPVSNTVAQKCIFKPRVMVLDNWGWCNGVCSSSDSVNGTISRPICYSGITDGTIDPPETTDQCNPSEQANTTIPGTISDQHIPWAAFTGTVEVRR